MTQMIEKYFGDFIEYDTQNFSSMSTDNPLHIPLTHVNFRIHVKDVPPGYYNESMAQTTGNFVGDFIEYDTRNLSSMSMDL